MDQSNGLYMEVRISNNSIMCGGTAIIDADSLVVVKTTRPRYKVRLLRQNDNDNDKPCFIGESAYSFASVTRHCPSTISGETMHVSLPYDTCWVSRPWNMPK